jgi:hypothetical protein
MACGERESGMKSEAKLPSVQTSWERDEDHNLCVLCAWFELRPTPYRIRDFSTIGPEPVGNRKFSLRYITTFAMGNLTERTRKSLS